MVLNYPDPPVLKISRAREALSRSGKNKAAYFAGDDYAIATGLWDSLLIEWKKQNSLFFFKRNFSRLNELSEKIILYAEIAGDSALNNKHETVLFYNSSLSNINEIIAQFDTKYSKLPLNQSIYNNISKIRLLIREAELIYNRGDVLKASSVLYDCLELSEACDSLVNSFISNYFENYPTWEKWVSDIISWSKKNHSVAIVVDKIDHSCIIYKKGKQVAKYAAEFGANWMGDKNYTGDKATPEGKYSITKKLEQKNTKYFKALLLNYPNEEDVIRYNNGIKNGTIPVKKSIGSHIEIHGEGGRGINWTEGCIALENKNMNELFNYAAIGTPVIIVGSIKPLGQIFEQQ